MGGLPPPDAIPVNVFSTDEVESWARSQHWRLGLLELQVFRVAWLLFLDWKDSTNDFWPTGLRERMPDDAPESEKMANHNLLHETIAKLVYDSTIEEVETCTCKSELGKLMQGQCFREDFKSRPPNYEHIVRDMVKNGKFGNPRQFVLNSEVDANSVASQGNVSNSKFQKRTRDGYGSAALSAANSPNTDDGRLSAAPYLPPSGLTFMRPTAKSKSTANFTTPPGLDYVHPTAKSKSSDGYTRGSPSSSSSSSYVPVPDYDGMPPPPVPDRGYSRQWRDKLGHQWTDQGRCCSICGTRKLKHWNKHTERDEVRIETFPLSKPCLFCNDVTGSHHGSCCTRKQSNYYKDSWNSWEW